MSNREPPQAIFHFLPESLHVKTLRSVFGTRKKCGARALIAGIPKIPLAGTGFFSRPLGFLGLQPPKWKHRLVSARLHFYFEVQSFKSTFSHVAHGAWSGGGQRRREASSQPSHSNAQTELQDLAQFILASMQAGRKGPAAAILPLFATLQALSSVKKSASTASCVGTTMGGCAECEFTA